MAPRYRISGLVVLRALACALVATLSTRAALADEPSLDGPWTLTPMTETFIVQQWGGSCGPAPVSRTLMPGGTATVERDGGELVVTPAGARRALRTDQCIDSLPTLARESHTSDGHTYRTRCATPANDPRHAVINTAYFLTGSDTLSIGETGRYEFTISGSRCVADVTREATAKHSTSVAGAASGAAAGAAVPSPLVPPATSVLPPPLPATPAPLASATADDAPCAHPGEPARLEVRPSRKLLRLGDTYRFRAIVLDADGCPTGTPIQWSVALAQGSGPEVVAPSIDGSGRLTVPGASTRDATFDVVATAAGRSARSKVEVASAESYEALLAQSGLDSNGERQEPAVTNLAASSLGGANARAEDGARRRRLVFIGIVCTLACLLGLVAAVAALRARKARAAERAAQARHAERMQQYEREKRDRETQHAAQVRAHLESVAAAQSSGSALAAAASGPTFCPSCHREFSADQTYCPFDANRLVAVAGHEALAAGPVGGICPTCRRGFNPGVRVCPEHGDELVPPTAMAQRNPPSRGKICPTCGGRFEGNAAFCGKDGTQLVLLN